MTESEYTPHLVAAINAPHRPTRVWRQNAGTVPKRDKRGRVVGAIHGAPPGAADLTGIIAPEGWRLEVEIKGAPTRVTKDQERWAAQTVNRGGIYLVCRIDPALDATANAAAHVEQLDAAIALRRSQP